MRALLGGEMQDIEGNGTAVQEWPPILHSQKHPIHGY